MSNLLPEGEYAAVIKKCHKDTLSDGSEVLFLELEVDDGTGNRRIIHDVIQTQTKLDQFLAAFNYPPGSMKLAQPER